MFSYYIAAFTLLFRYLVVVVLGFRSGYSNAGGTPVTYYSFDSITTLVRYYLGLIDLLALIRLLFFLLSFRISGLIPARAISVRLIPINYTLIATLSTLRDTSPRGFGVVLLGYLRLPILYPFPLVLGLI